MSFELQRDTTGVSFSPTPGELAILRRILARLKECLGRGECPAVEGAGPAGFSEEAGMRKELSELLDGCVRDQKAQQLDVVEQSLRRADPVHGVISVPDADIPQWIACINDLRIQLASGVKLPEDWSTDLDQLFNGRSAKESRDLILFLILSKLQQDLIEAEPGQ